LKKQQRESDWRLASGDELLAIACPYSARLSWFHKKSDKMDRLRVRPVSRETSFDLATAEFDMAISS